MTTVETLSEAFHTAKLFMRSRCASTHGLQQPPLFSGAIQKMQVANRNASATSVKVRRRWPEPNCVVRRTPPGETSVWVNHDSVVSDHRGGIRPDSIPPISSFERVPYFQSVADVRTTGAATVWNLPPAANSPHPIARVPTMFQSGDVGDAFPGCIVRRDRMADSLVFPSQ